MEGCEQCTVTNDCPRICSVRSAANSEKKTAFHPIGLSYQRTEKALRVVLRVLCLQVRCLVPLEGLLTRRNISFRTVVLQIY